MGKKRVESRQNSIRASDDLSVFGYLVDGFEFVVSLSFGEIKQVDRLLTRLRGHPVGVGVKPTKSVILKKRKKRTKSTKISQHRKGRLL